MFTIYYKGLYINGYCDKDECYVAGFPNSFAGKRFKSFRAAQLAITESLKVA